MSIVPYDISLIYNLRARILERKSELKTWIKYVVAAMGVYALLLCGMFAAMLQPPATFGHIMRKMPAATYLMFPFKPMWKCFQL